jgi:hypothetical protein
MDDTKTMICPMGHGDMLQIPEGATAMNPFDRPGPVFACPNCNILVTFGMPKEAE